jgi:Flp pilus assembly protein TadG
MSALNRLARDQRGAALIELALIAPMLAMFVIGISDISTAYSRQLALEQAAQRSIEKVMQTTGEDTAEATIKKEAVCQVNGTKTDGTCKTGRITTANVTVTYRLECNGVVKSYSNDCSNGEKEVRYILATVAESYTPMFSMHFNTVNGKWALSATAGVRVK